MWQIVQVLHMMNVQIMHVVVHLVHLIVPESVVVIL
jgi:hypothetical protein